MPRTQALAYRSLDFREEWESLLATSANLYAQYQSPDWFDHLRCADSDGLLEPVALRGASGRLVGVAPLRSRIRPLSFEIKGRVLWRLRVRAVSILGGQPLLVPDVEL